MATLCLRPTDCLAGQAFSTARRGVRAAPGPRQPTQQQRGRQAPATAAQASAAVQSRPERGQRGRRRPSLPAEARSLPHKRAMEDVVILKRGDPLPAALMVAAAPAAELSAAGRVGQRGRPDTDEEKKADAEKTEAAPAAARQTVVTLAKEAAAAAATAAKQLAPPASGYSGPSFAVVAPEPRALPIPVHFLKPRGRGHDGRALAPAAAAA